MPRRNHDKQFIIRFKDRNGDSKSTKVFSQGGKNARDHFSGGKVLRIGKWHPDQVHRVGDYNDLPDRLMKEFSRERRNRPIEQSAPEVKPVLES